MSLNHKRRIFRSKSGGHAPSVLRLPSRGMVIATLGASATLVATASLFIRSSDAPAHVPVSLHVAAPADRLAVLDGDTLRVGDQVVRLGGIVAPARGSTCQGADRTAVDCGAEAANKLASLVRGNAVDCTVSGHDVRGRPVAFCMAGGKTLNAALVQDGWAKAETADLREPETSARAAGRGIWRAGL